MKKTIQLAYDTVSGAIEHGSGFSIGGALKKLSDLLNQNTRIPWNNGKGSEAKSKLAMEAGLFFKRELLPHVREWQYMRGSDLAEAIGLETSQITRKQPRALEASDYVDPAGQLGTLSGTLVMQQCLPLFAYDYPELNAMLTDFSGEPGDLEETEQTRILSIPAVQKYNATLDANGRPIGFVTASPAQTQDAPITLTDYIAVPLVFGQATISATQRDLLQEQAPGAMKAMGGYFMGMVTKLITPSNFNAYATVTAPDANGIQAVPVAYAYYAKALQDFSVTDLDKLSAIMTQNKVPKASRSILLTTQYFAKLRSDPRFEFYYAASRESQMLTDQALPPKISGFVPYEAPYLPQLNNLAFFPFHKAGLMLKSRLPRAFKEVVGNTLIPGAITTIADPDTKMSVALVERVDLIGNYAEYRPEVMLGANLGDNRGALCGTTQ